MANHHRRSSGRQPVEAAVADQSPETSPEQIDGPPEPESTAPAGGSDAQRAAQAAGKAASTLNINDLKDMSIQKLTQVAKDLNVAGATGM